MDNVITHIRKNDTVKVLTGKERGKRGKVLRIAAKKNRAYVEGLNLSKKHQKPTEQNRQGGIVEKESPIHVSNLLIVCNKCDKGVRIKKKKLENNKTVRICVKCGEQLDKI